jgi:hypothetical protein
VDQPNFVSELSPSFGAPTCVCNDIIGGQQVKLNAFPQTGEVEVAALQL